MSLYDEITIHALGDTVFQTKSMGRVGARYHVNHEGKLTQSKDRSELFGDPVDCERYSGIVTLYGHRDGYKYMGRDVKFADGKLTHYKYRF